MTEASRLIPPKELQRNMYDRRFKFPPSSSCYRKYSFLPRTIINFEAASMISWTRFKHYGIGPTGTKSMTGQLVFCL